jgi:hypothetical protein
MVCPTCKTSANTFIDNDSATDPILCCSYCEEACHALTGEPIPGYTPQHHSDGGCPYCGYLLSTHCPLCKHL